MPTQTDQNNPWTKLSHNIFGQFATFSNSTSEISLNSFNQNVDVNISIK